MKKVLINENGVYVSTLDVLPETILPGYQVIDVEDDNLFLHDKMRYTDGIWEPYDPRSLADYRTSQWETVKAGRDQEINAGFSWNNFIFDSDPVSRMNIQGGVSAALLSESLNQPFQVTWTLKDNTSIDLTGEDMKGIGIALSQHLNTCYEKGRLLRDRINSSTTPLEVQAIVWKEPPPLPPGVSPGQPFTR